VGKTHLLHATLALAGSERPKSPRVHLPLPELIDRLVEAIQAEQPVARHLGWEGADLVALDDLHLLKGRTVTQRELGRLLVEAAAKGTKVIGAAGGPPADLEDLWAILRRAPRFHSATLRRPHGPEFRNIVASIAGGAPSPTHPTWRAIAASSEGDVRRALGALTRHQFAHNLFATSAPAR
jgi:chromosomal replication initiation ATPase DnaA